MYAQKTLTIGTLKSFTEAFLVIAATSCAEVIFSVKEDIKINEEKDDLISSRINRVADECHSIHFDFPVKDFSLYLGDETLVTFVGSEKLVKTIKFSIQPSKVKETLTMSYRCDDSVARFDVKSFNEFLKPYVTYSLKQKRIDGLPFDVSTFVPEIIFA
jgi:hypothetical protein